MAKTCFIISSIGEEESDIRKRADMVYELMFEPILKELGYVVTRSDKIGSAGLITREIVKQIINSDLIIADVSDQNPNVFYELAIRNMIKKPVIVFKEVAQRMPFDIYDKRAIPLDTKNPRVWENAKKMLKTQIKNAEEEPANASESILSDISFELDLAKKPKVEENIGLELKDSLEQFKRIAQDITRQKTISLSSPSEAFSGMIASIELGSGAGVPKDKSQKLIIPDPVVIKRGESVLWVNSDTVSHTITNGKASDDTVGTIFDSGLIKSGRTFSFTFNESGTYPYFDVVHPWIVGIVYVR